MKEERELLQELYQKKYCRKHQPISRIKEIGSCINHSRSNNNNNLVIINSKNTSNGTSQDLSLNLSKDLNQDKNSKEKKVTTKNIDKYMKSEGQQLQNLQHVTHPVVPKINNYDNNEPNNDNSMVTPAEIFTSRPVQLNLNKWKFNSVVGPKNKSKSPKKYTGTQPKIFNDPNIHPNKISVLNQNLHMDAKKQDNQLREDSFKLEQNPVQEIQQKCKDSNRNKHKLRHMLNTSNKLTKNEENVELSTNTKNSQQKQPVVLKQNQEQPIFQSTQSPILGPKLQPRGPNSFVLQNAPTTLAFSNPTTQSKTLKIIEEKSTKNKRSPSPKLVKKQPKIYELQYCNLPLQIKPFSYRQTDFYHERRKSKSAYSHSYRQIVNDMNINLIQKQYKGTQHELNMPKSNQSRRQSKTSKNSRKVQNKSVPHYGPTSLQHLNWLDQLKNFAINTKSTNYLSILNQHFNKMRQKKHVVEMENKGARKNNIKFNYRSHEKYLAEENDIKHSEKDGQVTYRHKLFKQYQFLNQNQKRIMKYNQQTVQKKIPILQLGDINTQPHNSIQQNSLNIDLDLNLNSSNKASSPIPHLIYATASPQRRVPIAEARKRKSTIVTILRNCSPQNKRKLETNNLSSLNPCKDESQLQPWNVEFEDYGAV